MPKGGLRRLRQGILTLMDWKVALALFVMYMLIDGLYAIYTVWLVAHHAARAASAGAVMYVVIAFGTISYVSSYWYVIPIFAGSWVGTFVTVSVQRRRARAAEIAPAHVSPKLEKQ